MTDRNNEHRSGNQTPNTGWEGQRQQAKGQGGQQYGRQQGYQHPQQQSRHDQPWQQSQQEREYGQVFDRGHDTGGSAHPGGSQGYGGYRGGQQGEGYGNSSGYGSPVSDRYSGVGGYQGASFVSPADTQQGHAGMGRQSFSGKGPKNYTRSDERLTEDLCERLTLDHDIDASEIEVKVAQGTATLEGTVPQRWMKHRAEDLADGCPGVRNVENRIKVQSESSYGASSTLHSSGSQTDPPAGPTGSSSSGTAH